MIEMLYRRHLEVRRGYQLLPERVAYYAMTTRLLMLRYQVRPSWEWGAYA